MLGILNVINDCDFVAFISDFDMVVLLETSASKPGLVKLECFDKTIEIVIEKDKSLAIDLEVL